MAVINQHIEGVWVYMISGYNDRPYFDSVLKMKILIIVIFALILLLLGPLYTLYFGGIHLKTDWRVASRKSAGIAPDPRIEKEAIIQVYGARAFNWRGAFAIHTWMAVKAKDAEHYTVYQVIGWRSYMKLPVLVDEKDIPDRIWFDYLPQVILDIRGERAQKLIPKIQSAVKDYRYRNRYVTWPGPNSNTFMAYIGRQVPELSLLMPNIAIGKDYLVNSHFFARAPSGTGYQLSFSGYFGVLLAFEEGLEINILGLVFGIDPKHIGIKIPGLGEISLLKKSTFTHDTSTQ